MIGYVSSKGLAIAEGSVRGLGVVALNATLEIMRAGENDGGRVTVGWRNRESIRVVRLSWK
jgi:hypothetical protein